MGGEPWCFHPHQIADLTDFQIHNVYVKPAVERAKRESAKMQTQPQSPTSSAPANHVGPTVAELGATADEVVEFYVGMGLSVETARRMAAEQLGTGG